MAQKYGTFIWECPKCHKKFVKDTPQGLAMARENHWRTHKQRSPKSAMDDLGGCCGTA